MAQSLSNRSRLLEKYTQVVREDGLNTNKNVNIGINGTTANLWVSGSVTTGGTISGGAQTITSTSANALTVGANGTTNPQFKVDASATSVATGLNIAGAAAASGLALSVLSSGTNENLKIDAKGSGSITLNGTATGAVVVGSTTGGSPSRLSVVSAGSNALAVGLNGTINPAFNVDASTASSATGLKVKSAAAAGGLAVSVISSGTDESLTIDAKGTGTITLQSGTAVPAAGSAAASVRIGTSGPGVFVGSGAPTVTAPQGSLYLRTDGSSTSTRAYINSDGATTWVAVTTAS